MEVKMAGVILFAASFVCVFVLIETSVIDRAAADEECNNPVDIEFLLDSSGSIGEDNYQKQLDFVKAFVNSLTIGPNDVQIGITLFSSTVSKQFFMNSYTTKSELIAAIDQIVYSGGTTHTGEGLEFVRNQVFVPQHGDRPRVPNILIVTTDGMSSNPAKLQQEADLLHKETMEVFAIGVGSSVLKDELNLIAGDPGNVFTVDNFAALDTIQAKLRNDTCHASPTAPKPTTTFTTQVFLEECKHPADIHFLLDSSGSIGEVDYLKQLNFIKHFVNSLPIGPADVQIGLTLFSSGVNNVFWMNNFTTQGDIIAAIDKIVYTGGTTHMGDAIEFVRNQAFTTQHGDRPDATNILIVTTDGLATDPAKMNEQAKLLHQENINVFSVGVGPNSLLPELTTIAGDPQNVFTVVDFSALDTIAAALLNSTCTATTPPPTEAILEECKHPADIHFLLDSSGSITQSDYQKQMDFVKEFIKSFNIGPNDVQIGVTIFSDTIEHQFWMNNYTDKGQLLAAIDRIPYLGYTTNTGMGIEFVRQQAFTPQHGDRPDAINILIVTTDGQSSDSSVLKAQAALLHQQNINTFSIGVGTSVDLAELALIASNPQNVFTVTDFTALQSIQTALLNSTCGATTAPPTTPAFTIAETCKHPADIHFLLDSSGSIGEDNYQKQLDFVKGFVNAFDVGPQDVQIGLTLFSSTVTNQFFMNTYTTKAEILAAIDQIQYYGGTTHTGAGLEFVQQQAFTPQHGDRPGVPNILIVTTDGQSTNPTKLKDQAALIHKEDINVFSIGVGTNIIVNELNLIASQQSNVFTVTDFSALNTIQATLLNSTCEEIVTQQPTVAEECKHPADIHFLLDSSGSIGTDNYQKQLDFVKSFVKSFNIGPNDVQVGLTLFGSTVDNEFWLNSYTNKSDILAAIDSIVYAGGTTHTGEGLEFVRQQAFTPQHGDRPDAINILIVTTDGQSTNPSILKNQSDLIHQENINVFSIGVGTNIIVNELNQIATNLDNVFTVSDFAALNSIKETLLNSTCGATTTAPPATTVTVAEECKHPADIHFLLDSSGSIGEDSYQKQLDFVKQFIRSFNIGPNDVQIGVTLFGSTVNNQFWMNTYTDKNKILAAIDNITYPGGTTHTGDGIEFVRNQVFSKLHGDRPDAINILIVTTDGQSTNPTKLKDQAALLHQENIDVFAIGVGSNIVANELGLIASDPQNVFTVTDFAALQTIQSTLLNQTCGATTTIAPPTTPNSIINPSNSSSCSLLHKLRACTIMLRQRQGIIGLAKEHKYDTSLVDNATAYNNINDMCDGYNATRAYVGCACPLDGPGKSVCISTKVLDFILHLSDTGHVVVNELAGACHSCPSANAKGMAVDLLNDARGDEYERECITAGGWAQYEDGHVHCQFYEY